MKAESAAAIAQREAHATELLGELRALKSCMASRAGTPLGQHPLAPTQRHWQQEQAQWPQQQQQLPPGSASTGQLMEPPSDDEDPGWCASGAAAAAVAAEAPRPQVLPVPRTRQGY